MKTPNTSKVKNKAFNLAIQLLLNGSTPAISVSEAAVCFNDYVFLDARAYREYEVSHLKNARHVDPKNFSVRSMRYIPNNQPVIVYCSIGKRSDTITQLLIQAGYNHVYNLYGGIFEWVNQGLPVYDMEEQPTPNVHAYSIFWGRWVEHGIKVSG